MIKGIVNRMYLEGSKNDHLHLYNKFFYYFIWCLKRIANDK